MREDMRLSAVFGFLALGVFGVFFLLRPHVALGAAGSCQGADVNGDGVVNIIDLVTIARSFGARFSPGIYSPDAYRDVSGDGVVNIIDLVTVARQFGRQCSDVSAIPRLTVSLDSTFFNGGSLFVNENGSSDYSYVMGRFLLSASGGDVVISRIVPAVDPFPSAEFSVGIYDGSFSFPDKTASFTGDVSSVRLISSRNDWDIFNERSFIVPDGATIPIILSFSDEGDISDISRLRVGIQSFSFEGVSPEVSPGLPLFGPSRDVLSLEHNLPAPSSEKVRPRIKFFVDPRVAGGVSLRELGDRLSAYVRDLNSVFLRSTRVEYVFDPSSDVVLTDYFPGSGGCTYLDKGYEVGVVVRYDAWDPFGRFLQSTGRGGGLCRIFPANNMSLVTLGWARVYGRDDLLHSLDARSDYYWRQLHPLIHEFGHIYGLGVGEYYNLGRMEDTTGIPPLLNLSPYSGVGFNFNHNDFYWGNRSDAFRDPMYGGNRDNDGMIRDVQFAPFSSRVINTWALEGGDIDNDSPKEASIAVEVLDSNRRGISGCEVRVFTVQAGPPHTSSMVNSGQTNTSGRFEFLWSTLSGQSLHNSTNMIRLVKVVCDGYAPHGQWLSVFDVQAARYMPGGGVLGDFHYPGKLEFIMERAPRSTSDVFNFGKFFSNLFDIVSGALRR